jgi:bifunctional DNase/RNase
MLLVDLVAIQVDAGTGAALLVLREHDSPHRLLPISIGGEAATSIAFAASGQSAPRPLTHDLMATLVQSFEGHLDAVEVTDLRDGTFIASLALSGPIGERHIDTRPSDAIALAVRLDAPLYVSEHVLDQAGSLPPIELDDEAIDAEVDEFRTLLDHLDPSDFLTEAVDDPSDHDPSDHDPSDHGSTGATTTDEPTSE